MDSVTPVSPTPAAPRSLNARFWLNTWRGRFFWFFAGILLSILVVWGLVRMTPPWFGPMDPTDQNVIDLSARAQSVLLQLHTAVERVPLGEQPWSITQNEINSFLAIQSARMEGADIPVSDPCIVFGEGTVSISARLKQLPGNSKQGGVGTMIFSVGTVDVDGKRMGQVKLIGVRAGRLPIPTSLLESRLRNNMPGIIKGIEQILSTQLNVRDTTAIEETLRTAGEGRPFPLDFRINRKELVVKEIRVQEGIFAIVFAPPPRPTTLPSPATVPANLPAPH